MKASAAMSLCSGSAHYMELLHDSLSEEAQESGLLRKRV